MIDDQRYCFLFHYTPPPDFGGDPFLLVLEADGKVRVATLEEMSTTRRPLVTHSFSLLVDWFRNRGLPLPKQVVDLEVAQKLIVGRPKSDFEVERPWDMPSMLRRFVHARYDARSVRAALATHMGKPAISDFGNLRWMTSITAGLGILWSELLVELEAKGELRRFFDVEVPAYNAMLASQYRGINIDARRRDGFLQVIEDDYVSAHHQLAIGKGIDVEHALVDAQYLSEHLVHPIPSTDEFSEALEVIEARKDFDPVCALLDIVATARRDRSILLRSIGNDAEYCYPVFDTMGTVTGRILAVDPHLQHLNKKYRSIVEARAGQKLVYVDYSQFEPNIMASISKDPQLLTLCSKGDLYERLAVELCGDAKHRKTVKLMFLAYSYGKQLATLSDFLVGIHNTREKAEALITQRFVPLFAGIEKWKMSVEGELLKAGRIGTLLGNYRYRTNKDDLSAKERRWAISQVVQGTGSLILKNLINMLTNELPEVSVLLPMYDALLVEVPEGDATSVTTELLDCCRKAFSEVCPLVTPSVCEKGFAE
jgi:DNA polymerase I-like protein with 3'-5' exonuclease and polymerase domains